jgi:hypothetical protein
MAIDDPNTILAVATVFLAIVTAAMAIGTFKLACDTAKATKQAQRHHEENIRETQDRERLARNQVWESIVVLAGNCIDAVSNLLKNFPSPPTFDREGDFLRSHTRSDFDIPMDGLAAVPSYLVGNPALVVAVLEFRGVMGRITRHLDDVGASKGVMPFSRDLVRAQGTPLFNAFASIMRIVGGQNVETENEIRRRTSGLS